MCNQEEGREKRDNYVPEVSALNVEKVEVDAVTMAMLQSSKLFSGDLSGIVSYHEEPKKSKSAPKKTTK